MKLVKLSDKDIILPSDKIAFQCNTRICYIQVYCIAGWTVREALLYGKGEILGVYRALGADSKT
jgi:hypothetical protein